METKVKLIVMFITIVGILLLSFLFLSQDCLDGFCGTQIPELVVVSTERESYSVNDTVNISLSNSDEHRHIGFPRIEVFQCDGSRRELIYEETLSEEVTADPGTVFANFSWIPISEGDFEIEGLLLDSSEHVVGQCLLSSFVTVDSQDGHGG